MPNDVKLESFPGSVPEALAYLYVKSQDLSGMTPTQIHTMYYEAYYEISRDRKAKLDAGWFKEKREEVRRP